MKTSKRPVFKLNTSELPKDYKQPLKPKKRKGHRGPRRIVRSRRRNEFIPEGADWCEINGQKLRQDIFFGEKRGRKFIPGRLLGDAPDFFVPSIPEGAGTELLEAPYGDGGDGGSCGCACEGCVCDAGEGCACTGPGTDSDTGGGFGQGFSEAGQQGQQGQQQGQEGPSFSDPTGSTLSNDAFFGSGPSFSDPTGSTLSNDAFFGSGPSYSDPTGSTLSNDAFFGSGPSFSDPTGSTLSNDAFFGTGPSYSDPTGSTLSNDAFFGTGPAYSDPTGSTLSNDAFFGTGPAYTSDPSGRSGMDMDFNPFSTPTAPDWSTLTNQDLGLPGLQNEQGVVGKGLNTNPIDPEDPNLNPDPFAPPFGPAGPLGAPGLYGPTEAPSLNIGIPGLSAPGLDAQGKTAPQDPGLTGFLNTAPTSPQQTPDAVPGIPAAIEAILGALNPGVIAPAHGQVANPDSFVTQAQAPTTSQQGLNNTFDVMNAMNAQTAQSNPGLLSAMQSFANPEVDSKGLPGLPTNPEAPTVQETFDILSGKTGVNPSMIDEQGRDVFAPSIYSRSEDLQDPGRTMTEPHTVMMDPGRTVGPQDQPSIEEFWGEKGPGVPSLTNPFADNPDVLSGRDQLAQDLQASQQANPFGMQQDDSRAGVTQQQINEAYQAALQAQQQPQDPNVPTAEQMQEAKDTLARDMERGPTNQPSLDEFLGERGRTMENPHNFPTMQELFDAREQQLAARDFTAKELQQERQSQLEQQRSDRGVELQDQRGLERGRDPVVAPSRGQERGTSRGQERGTPFAPTSRGQTQALGRGPGITNLGRGADRGTGRDSPGVQGLPAGLRGNDLAQALVSRGFDANLVGAALTIGDRGAMLTAMLEAAGLSHAQAVATANAARGAVEAQHGLPSNRR